MTIRTILTRLVPTLSGLKARGKYDAGTRTSALDWVSELGGAAMSEGYDASDALTALMALSKAEGFEMQQLALIASHGLCDALLGDIASNVAPRFAPIHAQGEVVGILQRISRDTCKVRDVYVVPSAMRREMIETGASLEKAVARDVAAGVRPAADAGIARAIHESLAEVVTCSFLRRDQEATRTLDTVARLAA